MATTSAFMAITGLKQVPVSSSPTPSRVHSLNENGIVMLRVIAVDQWEAKDVRTIAGNEGSEQKVLESNVASV
jgi:hypothetical protein